MAYSKARLHKMIHYWIDSDNWQSVKALQTHIGLHSWYIIIKVKVKCTLVQALRLWTGHTAHRGSRGIALLFHDHGTRRGEESASRPGRSLPPGKTWYPLYRRLGGPQGPSGQVRKISRPPGFDPRTVQPVASRYSDWATRTAHNHKHKWKIRMKVFDKSHVVSATVVFFCTRSRSLRFTSNLI